MSTLSKLLIITGDIESLFINVWEEMISALKAKAEVILSKDPATSSQLLLSGDVSSVLVVSPHTFLSVQKPYRVLRDNVRHFAERQGGTVLFCGTFSSFINHETFDSYFDNEWKLSWKFGSYHRTTFTLNPCFDSTGKGQAATSTFLPIEAGLEQSYSQKAANVKGVSPSIMLYVSTSESMLESRVWSATPVDNPTESPAIFQCFGRGHVGYLGDVNGENGTTKAVLGLCGFTSTTKPPQVEVGTESPDVGGFYCWLCRKQENHGENYKRCAKCQACYYCSASCQKTHWVRGHNKECKYMGINSDKF